MEKEKRYIVAVRCKNTISPVVGSVKRNCMRCGEEVCVGKALQHEEVDGVMCDVCVIDYERESQEDIKYILKPEVVKEFIEHMNKRKLIGM